MAKVSPLTATFPGLFWAPSLNLKSLCDIFRLKKNFATAVNSIQFNLRTRHGTDWTWNLDSHFSSLSVSVSSKKSDLIRSPETLTDTYNFFFRAHVQNRNRNRTSSVANSTQLFCSHSRRGLCWCSVDGSVHRTNFGLGFRRAVLSPNSATCTEKRFELSVGVVSSRLEK